MIFALIFSHLLMYSIEAGLFCNEIEEIHHETWCYKLYDINLLIDVKSCLAETNSQFTTCLKDQLDKILHIYTLNSRLKHNFEFTALKSPFKDATASKIYLQLIEKMYLGKNGQLSFINILFNVFSYQNHGYIKNQPFKIENPNLLKHSDSHLDSLPEKCLFVHQTKNLNEKFSFKYGNCDKNFTFICIKNPNEVNSIFDRCSSYIESTPGGKWIECDKLFRIINQNDKHLISNSQKCCMYNLNLKVNFTTANKICSQFDSEVFTFEAKGYTSMLNSYDLYLDLYHDYSFENETKFLNFWTSCKIMNYPQNREFTCAKDLKKIEKFDFEFSLENGFLLYFLHYSFQNQTGFRIHKLNISQIFYSLDKMDLAFVKQLIRNFSQNMFLLVRRKETQASNLTTRLVGSQNMSCFKDHLNFEAKISLPFLDKCLHFSAMKPKNYSPAIDTSGILDFFDILHIFCADEKSPSGLTTSFLSLTHACSNLEPKKTKQISIQNNWFWSKFWNFSGTKKKIYLENYTNIENILQLNCYDSAKKIQNLIDDCIKFYDSSFCKYKCPENCSFNSDPYQVTVWQIGPFKYSLLSSICKSAYHSNKTNGMIYFSPSKKSQNRIRLSNNGIESLKWPLFNQDYYAEFDHFYFADPASVKHEQSSRKSVNALVLLKAIYFVKKNKLNSVSLKIFSDQNIGNVRLKYLVPAFDDFYRVDFSQQTQLISNNFYETHLSLNLSYKKLIFVNNYFEIDNNGIKFPINIVNIDYDCFWYLYNLNTFKPCDHDISFSSSNSTLGKNLIFYPKTEDMNLNFFKKLTRVIFAESNPQENCSKSGYFFGNRCICFAGFGGNRCEKVCKRGNFGFNCEFECPNKDCIGYLICNNDPVGCSCISGLVGFYCNEECADNKWGPSCSFDCSFCPNNKCDSFDGSCVCNEKSFGKYCENCMDGFYGKNCEYKCTQSCMKCNKENGECLDESKETNMNTTALVDSTKTEEASQGDVCDHKMLKCENIEIQIT
ncbi:multiple epidermal growth factor-like domains 6 [Brachionus plicatilis]|uniref:Multiple epidermal growth factor-like domains 6 n=1 Tax=Brachionus plicatilis TaxID=10195 RepID=A0A3M7R1M0_BRAPC|nr:multiple epidermal growth factor-like domains 6 [Brachionus plicatilis]